jgi:hypothetical protein
MMGVNGWKKFCMNDLDDGKKRNGKSGIYPDTYLEEGVSLQEILNLG